MRNVARVLILASGLLGTAPALADDWTADRLRGFVVTNDVHGTTQWARLTRGDVVSDDRIIRTMATGYVTFTRGNETISFSPNTQGEIVDRTGQRYTTVMQQTGEVSIEADARQVQHFAVATPFLVAVVKGTVFTVTTDRTSSRVRVIRGLVQIIDGQSHRQYMVPAGQTATAGAGGAVTITGQQDKAATHPVVNGVAEDEDDGSTAGTDGTSQGSGLAGVAGTVGTAVGGTVTGVTGAVGTVVGGTVGNTVSSLGSGVGNTVGSVGSTLGSTVSKATSGVGGIVHGLGL